MTESKRIIKYFFPIIILVLLFVLTINTFVDKRSQEEWVIKKDSKGNKLDKTEMLKLYPLIAHAGGGINSITYSNSKEALDLSYEKGFRFFELDFEWTSDNKLVLIHDFENSIEKLFNEPKGKCSLNEFKSFKMIDNLTQLTLDDLVKWIKIHPDVIVITDIKTDNIKALTFIKDSYPEVLDNFIPQIYQFGEFSSVKDLGYLHIILTLYRNDYSDEEIIKFTKENFLTAITMPIARGCTKLPKKLRKIGIPVYVHTINDQQALKQLRKNRVFGVYTD